MWFLNTALLAGRLSLSIHRVSPDAFMLASFSIGHALLAILRTAVAKAISPEILCMHGSGNGRCREEGVPSVPQLASQRAAARTRADLFSTPVSPPPRARLGGFCLI